MKRKDMTEKRNMERNKAAISSSAEENKHSGHSLIHSTHSFTSISSLSSLAFLILSLSFALLLLCRVDATAPKSRYGYGRYVNHSRSDPNMNAKLIQTLGETGGKEEHLCFVAKRDIEVGEELLFDYGERRRDVCNHFHWLRN